MRKMVAPLPGENQLISLIFESARSSPANIEHIIRDSVAHGQYHLVVFSLRDSLIDQKILSVINQSKRECPCLELGHSRDYLTIRQILRRGACDYLHWDDFVKIGLHGWCQETRSGKDRIPGTDCAEESESQSHQIANRNSNMAPELTEPLSLSKRPIHHPSRTVSQNELLNESLTQLDGTGNPSATDYRNQRSHRYIAKAKDFISMHYGDHTLTLGQVADHVSLSEKHFSRLFTKVCLMTFSEYLIGYRMDKAKLLLTNTDLKVYQVALQVGYSSVEHFSRYFKKQTSCSPEQFRK